MRQSKLKENELQEFVNDLEMTVLTNEDSILLEGMVGTCQSKNSLCNTDNNCSKACGSNNCQGGNCATGCGSK